MQFAVAFDNDVVIYDAETGKQSNHFRNIGKSAITSMCLDRRSRKLIIGYHNGTILVHNFMNGATMKTFLGHSNDGVRICRSRRLLDLNILGQICPFLTKRHQERAAAPSFWSCIERRHGYPWT